MKKNNTKAILLVAGEGKRLQPYTLNRPKCTVEVDGVSLLDRQLAVLKSENINNITLIGGYKFEMLRSYNLKLRVNHNFFKTNMLWTLFCAEDELEGELIVSYGDIVYSKKILKELLKSEADIAVVIDKNWKEYWYLRSDDPLNDAETLKLRKDGTISDIGQRPKSLNEIEGQYIGLMKFSDKGLNQMKAIFHKLAKDNKIIGKDIENAYMTDLLQALIKSGIKVSSVCTSDAWVEVDTVEDLNISITAERLREISHE